MRSGQKYGLHWTAYGSPLAKALEIPAGYRALKKDEY